MATAKYLAATALAMMALAAVVAVAQPAPAPAQRLEGTWAVEGGGQLIFSLAPTSGLEVEMVGLCDPPHGASPPTQVTYVAAIEARRGVPRRLARSCFFAQLCAPEGARAYCVEWPAQALAPRLLVMRYNHRRMLRDRSRGNHPLEVFTTKTMSRR